MFAWSFAYRMGGLVLDAAVGVFNGFVVFQPIINGIGGNLVSVQASKISTMLHQSSIIGIVPPHTEVCESPWRALVKGGKYSKHNATFRRITIHHLYSAICINFFFFCSSVRKNSAYSDSHVNTWANIVHLCCRLHPHDSINNWPGICDVILDR